MTENANETETENANENAVLLKVYLEEYVGKTCNISIEVKHRHTNRYDIILETREKSLIGSSTTPIEKILGNCPLNLYKAYWIEPYDDKLLINVKIMGNIRKKLDQILDI